VEQIHYAAADAYAGYRLYHMLEWKRTRLRPTPPPIPLCDYDNKPNPSKAKVPRKKTKAATKSEDVSKTGLDSLADDAEQEQEGDEDGDGYETASEEFIDSQQQEDASTSTFPKDVQGTEGSFPDVEDTELARKSGVGFEAKVPSLSRRVGRVDLSLLTGTDPGYPTLPRASQEETKMPSSTGAFKGHASKDRDVNVSSRSQLSDALYTSEDAYDDPELEEALGRMTLDDSGKLTEDAESLALEHTKLPASNAKEVELLEFDPTSLELQELAETIPVAPKPFTGLSGESSPVSQYETATTWAQEYVRSTIPSPTSTEPSRIRATVPHLRAYYLWYHQKQSIEEITRVLRDPPMSSSTVTNYILQAVMLEKVEYETESLRSVMRMMPSGMRKGRWKGLAEQVGALD